MDKYSKFVKIQHKTEKKNSLTKMGKTDGQYPVINLYEFMPPEGGSNSLYVFVNITLQKTSYLL